MAHIRPDTIRRLIEDALSPNPMTPLLPRPKHTSSTHSNDTISDCASNTANTDLDNDTNPSTPLNSSYYNILDPSSSPYPDSSVEDDTLDTARILFSSPIRLSPPKPDREQRYEVEHSFLQAIARLIERQANIIPASTLTKKEVRKLIRKELDARQQEDSNNNTADEGQEGGLASVVTMPVVLSATAAGATAVVLIRAGRMYPEEMKWFFGGAVKGGVLGFGSAMVVKGVLAGLEWLGRARDGAAWAHV